MSHHAFFDTLVSHLGSVRFGLPLTAIFYLIGIGASVFHLANGLVTFTMTWGLVTSRRAQGRLALVAVPPPAGPVTPPASPREAPCP